MNAAPLTMTTDSSSVPIMLLELVTGEADPATLRLFEGHGFETLSIGRTAEWRLDAEGVEDLHAALHFDGQRLFIVSHVTAKVIVNGSELVPNTWTQLIAPANIMIGKAHLALKRLASWEHPKEQSARGSTTGPILRASHIEDRPSITTLEGAPTRIFDIEQLLQEEEERSEITSNAERPATQAPGLPSVIVAPDPVEPRHEVTERRVSGFKQIPFSVRISALLILLGAGMLAMQSLRAAPSAASERTSPDASAKAQATQPTETAPTPALPPTTQPEAPRNQASAAPVAQPLKPLPKAGRAEASRNTEQRVAIDALISGNEAEARRAYEELAAKDPAVPAYTEAARILKRRQRPK